MSKKRIPASRLFQRRVHWLALGVALAACSSTNEGKRAESSEVAPSLPATSAHAANDTRLEDWHKVIRHTPPPKNGCFQTSFPSTTWTEVPCGPRPVGTDSTPPPPGPRTEPRGSDERSHGGPGGGVVPGQGGGTGDWFLRESAPITQATGSFPSVTGATTPNSYSIQLNSNGFTLTATSDSALASACPNGTCQVWQQVLYSTTVSRTGLYFQYWVLNNANACIVLETLHGWNAGANGNQCFLNGNNVSNVPLVPIADLSTMSVTVSAGSSDVITMTIEGSAYSGSFASELGLNQGSWKQVEYGVFGDLGLRGLNLDSNATTIVTHIEAEPYTSTASCTGNGAGGATGETNNLIDPTTVGNNPPQCCLAINNGAESGIEFTETDVTGQACTVCGAENQACCNGTNNGWCANPVSDVCVQGLCTPCGGNNQVCCANNACTAPGAVCQGGACGAPNVLVASPSSLSVEAGDGTTGANKAVTNLEASGLWAGNGTTSPSLAFQVVGVPAGVPLPPPGSAPAGLSWAITNDINPPTVQFTAATNTTPGVYTIAITGTIGGYQQTTNPDVTLTVSACQPLTCAAAGWTCGSFDNECGGTSNCGTCPSGDSCVGGKCTATCTKYCPPPEFLNPYQCVCETCQCGTIIVNGQRICSVCKP